MAKINIVRYDLTPNASIFSMIKVRDDIYVNVPIRTLSEHGGGDCDVINPLYNIIKEFGYKWKYIVDSINGYDYQIVIE